MRSNELGVLFRNNHFNTLFAHNGAIWMLATDQGYLFEVPPPSLCPRPGAEPCAVQPFHLFISSAWRLRWYLNALVVTCIHTAERSSTQSNVSISGKLFNRHFWSIPVLPLIRSFPLYLQKLTPPFSPTPMLRSPGGREKVPAATKMMARQVPCEVLPRRVREGRNRWHGWNKAMPLNCLTPAGRGVGAPERRAGQQ